MYKEMCKWLKAKYGEEVRILDYDEGESAEYVRYIFHSTIYIMELRKIGANARIYKLEGLA